MHCIYQNDNEQFTYDDLGNRTEVDLRDGTTDTYARNELTNRYDDDQGEDIVCEYDLAGNMTKDPNDYEYEYDYENRLIKITKNSGVTAVAEFEYDALGRRIEVYDNIADETTRYYYDGWRVLAEMDENGTQKRKYIYGNYLDEVLVKIEDDAEIYYAHNHLYSPVALVDDNGNVVERYEYNAYGQRTIWDSTFSSQRTSSSYNNPISFTGQRLDTYDNGSLPNMYYKYRNLDTYTGRFMQHDPIGYVDDGMNLYEYVSSTPVLDIDPFGLWIVLRDNGEKSKATSLWGDTMAGLAKYIGFNVNEEEFRKWVTAKGKIKTIVWGPRTLSKLKQNNHLCHGQEVEIPNTVIAYWGGALGSFGKFWVMWDSDIKSIYSGRRRFCHFF